MPMLTKATNEATHSNIQSFQDCFIHITPIDEEVAIKPSQIQAPQIPPLYHVFSPISGELKRIQKRSAITPAVMRFTKKFQAIWGTMSANFSLPVGWMFARRIHSLPKSGPWKRKPMIKVASAASTIASGLIFKDYLLCINFSMGYSILCSWRVLYLS